VLLFAVEREGMGSGMMLRDSWAPIKPMFATHTLECNHWLVGSRKIFLFWMVRDRRFGNFGVKKTALWKQQSMIGISPTYLSSSFGRDGKPFAKSVR
jgi:hypothetical protein